MSARKAMTPAEQDKLLRGVSGKLSASAPAGWTKLRLVYAALVDFSAARFETMFTSGRVESRLPPRTAVGELRTLREGMHLEGRGTWYTVHLEVNRSGRYTVRYSYDDRPVEPRTDLSHPLDPDRLRESGIAPGDMTPEEMMDTVQEIAGHAFEALGTKGRWTGILIDHKEVVGRAESRVTVDWAETGPEPEWLPPQVDRLLNKLRTGMYQRGKGTWFRARFRIEESREIGIEFDQKNPPDFDPAPDPRCYLWDVRRFPRSSAHIPDWLLERLSLAQRLAKAERVPPRPA